MDTEKTRRVGGTAAGEPTEEDAGATPDRPTSASGATTDAAATDLPDRMADDPEGSEPERAGAERAPDERRERDAAD